MWKALRRATSKIEEKEKKGESVPASMTPAVAMVCRFCS